MDQCSTNRDKRVRTITGSVPQPNAMAFDNQKLSASFDNSPKSVSVNVTCPPNEISLHNVAGNTLQVDRQISIQPSINGTDDMGPYESLSEQFNVLVLISTFTVALIFSFLSLANDIINNSNTTHFEVGMLLAFLSIGIHLWVAVVAGRAATICYREARTPKDRREFSPSKFSPYLILGEQLQVFGTVLFIPAVLLLIWNMFDHIVYSIVLYVLAVGSAYLVFRIGYWRVSVDAGEEEEDISC
ncbi:hypothetical protein ABKN59_003422 [Abortiporus biennis]